MVVDPFNHPSSLYTGTVSSKAFDAKTDQHVTVSELSTFDHSTSEIGEAVVSFTTEQDLDASPLVSEPVAIPAAFDEHIFDKAEQSVKYMVLTNTWPKFVDSRRESESTFERRRTSQRQYEALHCDEYVVVTDDVS
ncbi:hypothetical protein LTR28_010156 [Elasticomyces elasticus]|nr:hypothetical protein LTR28_010156 [Elasticomyces elasticus]